ncbi:MAG: ATP-binding protein [Thermococcus sp.]|uniref:ATP-binding protein n=1 Tax=Thermococcus sp. TaxID=35749 RepID=UPI000F20E594|nr:ATP-binding protein [Thermococcus sp.]MCD6140384.1 ATP-binding protein [Thermococcus sp.]RLF76114.1 MAG: ATPase [Thermococci archaeon]RLF80873.1 MAG: ATPase [Thermococci archaeon]RLF83438.1 MAG: ATPase [Thermococci archaeon]
MQIAIASGKGGVGKSSVAAALIYLLKDDYPLIAVDADADAPNLDLLFGVERWEEEKELTSAKVAKINSETCIKCGICAERCPYDCIKILDENYIVNELTCEGCGVCKLVCPVNGVITLEEVRSGVIRKTTTKYGFSLISAQLDVGRPNSGKLVTEEKEWAKRIMKEKGIEHMIVDSAAGIGCQVIASLSGANVAILVAEPTPASLSDVKRVYRVVQHFREPAYLIINKADLNPGFKGLYEFAKEEDIPIIGEIPYDRAIPKSMIMLKPVVEAFPESKASKALKQIAEVVKEQILRQFSAF